MTSRTAAFLVPALPAYRLLFVCMGNICRSPAGEATMRHLVATAQNPPKISCDSAGTIGYHTGSPPDPRMTTAARKRGITMTGSARKFRMDDFDRFDLILTMDAANHRDVLAVTPDQSAAAKVIPMVAFSRSSPPAAEVPDPYYGGAAGFETVLDILDDCCSNLLTILQIHQNK